MAWASYGALLLEAQANSGAPARSRVRVETAGSGEATDGLDVLRCGVRTVDFVGGRRPRPFPKPRGAPPVRGRGRTVQREREIKRTVQRERERERAREREIEREGEREREIERERERESEVRLLCVEGGKPFRESDRERERASERVLQGVN